MKCKDKKQFATKNGALSSLHLIWRGAIRHGKKGKLPCRAYKCYKCKKWHLTSEAFIPISEKKKEIKEND
jgi:D-lyxose ketol-isomerase